MKHIAVCEPDNNVTRYRKKEGLTQAELADKLSRWYHYNREFTEHDIMEIECYNDDQIRNMDINLARGLARILDTKPIDLFYYSSVKPYTPYKYGIFKSTSEVDPLEMEKADSPEFYAIKKEDDHYTAPLEIFETEEEAVKAFEKYSSTFIPGDTVKSTVYFISDLKISNENLNEDNLKAYNHGDNVYEMSLFKSEDQQMENDLYINSEPTEIYGRS